MTGDQASSLESHRPLFQLNHQLGQNLPRFGGAKFAQRVTNILGH